LPSAPAAQSVIALRHCSALAESRVALTCNK
jgi:hypothetical protein